MSVTHRPFTLSLSGALVVLGVLALAVAFAVGIGGPSGFAFCQIASAAFLLALAHSWRRPRAFLRLAGASLAAFAVLVVLHNLFEALAGLAAGVPMAAGAAQVVSVTSFLLAVATCPIGLAIGLLGMLATFVAQRRHRAP